MSSQILKCGDGVMTFKRDLQISEREYAILTDESEDVIMEDVIMDNAPVIWFKAASLLLLGTVIAAAFADPLVDAVNNFSTATSIPSFFISFIAMPLATNASEAVSAIIFASRKKKRTTSLTFSEVCFSIVLVLIFVWISDELFCFDYILLTSHSKMIISIITKKLCQLSIKYNV